MYSLIDANYMVSRAVHATEDFVGKEPHAGVVYKFLRMLWSVKPLGGPVAVFDCGHAPFRVKLLPEYKQKTKPDDPKKDAIKRQSIDELGRLLPKLGVPCVQVPGEEADDVIYRLTEGMTQRGMTTFVVSDDADYLQMCCIGNGLENAVRVYRPMKDSYVSTKDFVEAWGFHPRLHPLYKALVGDSSDNIKGVRGIGDVYARRVLTSFAGTGSRDWKDLRAWALRESVAADLGRQGQAIVDNWDVIGRNVRLVDLSLCDLDHPTVEGAFRQALADALPDVGWIEGRFRELQFFTLTDWLNHVKRGRPDGCE